MTPDHYNKICRLYEKIMRSQAQKRYHVPAYYKFDNEIVYIVERMIMPQYGFNGLREFLKGLILALKGECYISGIYRSQYDDSDEAFGMYINADVNEAIDINIC